MTTTRSGLSAGKITNLATNAVVYFMFNPQEYTISKSNTWSPRPVNGANLPLVSFSQGGPQSISLTLYFDTQRQNSDVRAHTAPLWQMMMINEATRSTVTGKGEPPPVAFEWGQLYFKSIMLSLSEQFTLFSSAGVPLRSKVTVTLQQFIDEGDLPPQVPGATSSGTGGTTTQMQQGNRMDNVASQNGMPPESHRQIAEDNNIDNPMNVPTGQPLTVRPGGGGSGGTSGGTGR
jgi:hypothetical protein